MPQWRDGCVHTNPNPWNGNVHKVCRMLLLTLVVLQPLQKLQEDFLGHLASSTLQVGKPREPKVCLKLVSRGVKRPSNCQSVRILTQLQLCRLGQRILGCLSNEKMKTSSQYHAQIHNNNINKTKKTREHRSKPRCCCFANDKVISHDS